MDGPILPLVCALGDPLWQLGATLHQAAAWAGAIFRTWPLSVEGYRDRPVTPVGPYGGRAPEGDR